LSEGGDRYFIDHRLPVMKKIVIIPGVGIFDDGLPDYELFFLIKKMLPEYECEMFNWSHSFTKPKLDLGYSFIRKWFCEVLYDFQTVIEFAMDVDVPEADYYIGHSAGSILALMQPRPSIICGSPAALVTNLQGRHSSDLLLNSNPVYNLIHERDVIAYPLELEHVENEIVLTRWWRWNNWEPVSAHLSYLRYKPFCTKIINKIVEWEAEELWI
jgi:hypothetical protein